MLDFQTRFTAAEGAGIGMPYVSHDIGSFNGNELPNDIYVRWIQAGAVAPILRLHSNHAPRLPWEYGGRAEKLAELFLRLRESLVPYIYTLARQAYDTGLPIARAMYLELAEARRRLPLRPPVHARRPAAGRAGRHGPATRRASGSGSRRVAGSTCSPARSTRGRGPRR